MPYFSHPVSYVVSSILFAACHSKGGRHLLQRRTTLPDPDDDCLSLLQTSTESEVSDTLRRGSVSLGRRSGPLNKAVHSATSGPPRATDPYDHDWQWWGQPIGNYPPVESLLPCWATPGGGCAGGLNKAQDSLFLHVPAPPQHFPAGSGCQWNSPKRIAFLHVGKCAGESLLHMLNHAPVNFTHVHEAWHVNYFDPDDYDLFVISTRDPVNRVRSAFNFARDIYHRIGPISPVGVAMTNCLEETVPGEDGMGVMNAFAEALGPGPWSNHSNCGRLARRCLHSPAAFCPHLSTGFAWYAQTGHRRFSQSLISAVGTSRGTKHMLLVPSENFSAGAAAMFDWLCVPPESRPEDMHVNEGTVFSSDTYLSPTGRQNLENHLADEYFVHQELSMLADPW